ncbi:unnamed protein product [Enterobius vermicularis]|uniref:Cystine/glutamate transporter n=1 Tax=Enterobius vermicularis TaxID=51028 RepID=A0A0N4VKM9_ENTVE|nr:unnamed protein product [Enterobius vermicularis]
MVIKKPMVTTGRVITQKIGLIGAISYLISNIVGSGIFIAPTTILIQSRSPGLSLIIWGVSAIISTLGSFCYIELGTSIRLSGADFAYLCYVRWFSIAFAFMCAGCILNYPAAVAIQADTFTEYLFEGFKIEADDEVGYYCSKKLLGFLVVWLIVFINFFSLKRFVARFQMVATFAKVISTSIIIVTGFYLLLIKGEIQDLSHPFKGTNLKPGSIVLSLYAGLFSYDGWDILNFGTEEIEKPRRTMPLSIILGMTIVAIIYMATNVAYFVALSVDEILTSDAVATAFAAKHLGSFQYAMPFLICVLLVGSINTTVFSGSRYLYAAARQGHLPSFISCTHLESNSPRTALFVNAVLAMFMSFVGDLNALISYVGFTQWAQRLITMGALLLIRYKQTAIHPDAIRTPLILSIIFFMICLSLVIVTILEKAKIAIMGMGVVAVGFLLYYLFIYEKSLPSLKCYQKFSKHLNSTAYHCLIFFKIL